MVEPPARRGPDEPTTDANLAFVQRHLAHRHLQFTPLASWPGHRGALTREAKRRGLTVREQDKSMYFFEAGRCIGGTVGLITTLVGYSAARTTRSKTFTKDLLTRAGLPVPRADTSQPPGWTPR